MRAKDVALLLLELFQQQFDRLAFLLTTISTKFLLKTDDAFVEVLELMEDLPDLLQ